MAKVLGLDAGFTSLGAVLAEDSQILWWGCAHTEKTVKRRGVRVADDDAERCQSLARWLLRVIAEQRPAGVVVELPTGGAQGARANRAMGMATGVVTAVLEITGIPVEWVTPADVKKAAAASRSASKDDVGAAVREAFRWQELPKLKKDAEHVFDAAGTLLAAKNGTMMRTLDRLGAG